MKLGYVINIGDISVEGVDFDGKEEEGVYPIPEKVMNELFEFAKYFYELGVKARKGE